MKRLLSVLALATLTVGIATPIFARKAHETQLTKSNRALITDFARLFYTERNVRGAFARYVAPDYIQHNPQVADGRDAAVAMLTKLFGAPDARFVLKRIVVDGDIAVIHLHGQLDAISKGVAVVDIYRLHGGKIVEHWDVVQSIPDTAANAHPMF